MPEYVYPADGPPELREAYSHDPYMHTSLMDVHTPFDSNCGCQTCVQKFGIWKGGKE